MTREERITGANILNRVSPALEIYYFNFQSFFISRLIIREIVTQKSGSVIPRSIRRSS